MNINNDPQETWKRIDDTHYFVSNTGKVMNSKRGKELANRNVAHGYQGVTLGVGNQRLVHRLVAKAFVANDSGLPHVNHIDEDKANNNASNLEWCTPAYNNEYSKAKNYKLKSPSGEIIEVFNLNKFCKENGLEQPSMSKVTLVQRKSHSGWTTGDKK